MDEGYPIVGEHLQLMQVYLSVSSHQAQLRNVYSSVSAESDSPEGGGWRSGLTQSMDGSSVSLAPICTPTKCSETVVDVSG